MQITNPIPRSGVAPSFERAISETVLAASLWGFGFIAGRWIMGAQGPVWGHVSRYAVALLAGLPVVLYLGARRGVQPGPMVKSSALPGLLLCVFLVLQMYGLKYTSVANCAFLTCLYVVFVPLLEPLAGSNRPGRLHWSMVCLALVGAYFMARPSTGGWNYGDLLTVVCAFVGAVQILTVHRAAATVQSPFVFNYFQGLWALVPAPLIALVVGEPFTMPSGFAAWGGVLFIGIGSSLFAFYLQVRAQSVLPMSLVSMVFLLESPFAAVFGFWIFGETLAPSQWLGAALILASSAVSLFAHRPRSGGSVAV